MDFETVSVGINSAATSEQGSPGPPPFQVPPPQRFRVHSTSSPRKSFSTISVGSCASSVHGSVHGRRKRRRTSGSAASGVLPPMVFSSDDLASPMSRNSGRRSGHSVRRHIIGSSDSSSIAMEAGHPGGSSLTYAGSPQGSMIENPLAFAASIEAIAERAKLTIPSQLSLLPSPVFIDLYSNVARMISERVWASVVKSLVPSHLVGHRSQNISYLSQSVAKKAIDPNRGLLAIKEGGTVLARMLLISMLSVWTINMSLSKELPLTVQLGSDLVVLFGVITPVILTCSTQILSHLLCSFDFILYSLHCLGYLSILCSELSKEVGFSYAMFSFCHRMLTNLLWFPIDSWCLHTQIRMLLAAWLPLSNLVTFIVMVLLWPDNDTRRLEMSVFFTTMIGFQLRSVYCLIVRPGHWTAVKAHCTRHWYRSLTSLNRISNSSSDNSDQRRLYQSQRDNTSAGIAAAFRGRKRRQKRQMKGDFREGVMDYPRSHRRPSFSEEGISEMARLYPSSGVVSNEHPDFIVHSSYPTSPKDGNDYLFAADQGGYGNRPMRYSPEPFAVQMDGDGRGGYITVVPDESSTEVDYPPMGFPNARHIHQQRLPPPSVLGRSSEQSFSRLTGITEETYQSQII